MNNKSIKWLTGTLMTAMLASAFTACTDDHFDINSDVLGTKTIWENIKSNSNLSEYADILQNVKYSTSEQKSTDETYADVLNGDQTFTVWAPENGSFNYSYYKKLLESGIRDSIYKVEKELIRNNMTRYANVINGKDSVKLALFNDKSAWLNYNKLTFKNAKITTPNIGSSNGVLHIVNKPVVYQYNLYEYMSANPQLDSLNKFIKKWQEYKFDESASTQGPTIDGKITWVDSVSNLRNNYDNNFLQAYLEREDSNYVMIMPTNKAWKETLEKTVKYYKYKSSYIQDVNTQTETGKDTTITGVETTFTQAELDSLLNLRSKNGICQNLAFNANWQYEKVPITSVNAIRALDARKDSILSTSGTKFKKTGTINETNSGSVLEVDDYVKMFCGNTPKEPVETSNGYAYVVDEFGLPSTVYAPVINNQAMMCYESCETSCVISSNTLTYTDTISGVDSIYKYSYVKMSPKTVSSKPTAYFKLQNVLSCKYDIFVVIGYNLDYMFPNKFRAYISYDTEEKRIPMGNVSSILKNPNEEAVDEKGKSIYNTNYFVNRAPNSDEEIARCLQDTICLAKDFEFPVCYYGLTNAYPVIKLECSMTTSEKSLYTPEIWVVRFILKPKE